MRLKEFIEAKEFADYLQGTLIPDMRSNCMPQTAKDLTKAHSYIIKLLEQFQEIELINQQKPTGENRNDQ